MLTRTPKVIRLTALVLAVGLIAPSNRVGAQEGRQNGMLQAGEAPRPQVDLGEIKPSDVFHDSDYETGGTGMRNQRRGGITINGVTGEPIAAYLYWAVITTGPASPKLHGRQKIQRRWPPPVTGNVTVVGTVVGTGGSPCWPGDTLTVFRAPVPLVIATGNGFYQVQTISLASTSSVAGEDPWEPPPLPAPFEEGKTLVVIYKSAGTTNIFDGPPGTFAGTLYFGTTGLTYTNVLSGVTGGVVKWDNITADGQKGSSRLAVLGVSDEVTIIDGALVAGPGSPATDSDQNGNDSTPVPTLWDTRGHMVKDAGADGILDVAIFSASGGAGGFDCLNVVANIVHF